VSEIHRRTDVWKKELSEKCKTGAAKATLIQDAKGAQNRTTKKGYVSNTKEVGSRFVNNEPTKEKDTKTAAKRGSSFSKDHTRRKKRRSPRSKARVPQSSAALDGSSGRE
jgi:hypothetical protein